MGVDLVHNHVAAYQILAAAQVAFLLGDQNPVAYLRAEDQTLGVARSLQVA